MRLRRSSPSGVRGGTADENENDFCAFFYPKNRFDLEGLTGQVKVRYILSGIHFNVT